MSNILQRGFTRQLISLSFLSLGLCLISKSVSAQTVLDFSITYDTEFLFPPLDESLLPESVDISPLVADLPPEFQAALPEDLPSELIEPEILDVLVTGTSVAPDPEFGLTDFVSDTVGLPLPPQIDPVTGQPARQVSIFRADPADLNLDLETPAFSDIYFGDDTGNRIFGLANDRAIFDFVEGTVQGGGIITIVGGEGIFEGAMGEIAFSQQDDLGPPGEPVRGTAVLDFSVELPDNPQTTPEPSSILTWLIAGLAIISGRRSVRS